MLILKNFIETAYINNVQYIHILPSSSKTLKIFRMTQFCVILISSTAGDGNFAPRILLRGKNIA